MSVLASAAGAVLLVLTFADLFLTVFQPSLRGPVSKRLNRAVWTLIRLVAPVLGRRALTFAGPLAVVADVLLWIGGLVVGFALLYLPALDSFSYTPGVPFGDHDAVEAFYVSGVVALTIGFGDVVGATDPLRLLTVAEGASGAALISAAVTYVLSVYPIVTDHRATAVRVSDLGMGDPDVVRGLLGTRGLAIAETVHDALIRNRQHLLRFPVLYYFHPPEEAESTYAMLHATAVTCAVLRWGEGGDSAPAALRYGDAIAATLDRAIDDYVSGFVRGLSNRGAALDAATARRQLARIRGRDGADPAAVAAYAGWAGGVEHFLAGLAREHGYASRRFV